MTRNEQKLYRQILWPGKKVKFDIQFFDYLQPCRVVSEHPRYKSGLFYSEKCNRQIQYESGLELDFIKQLEGMKSVLFYWEQPVQISYRRGKRKSTYTPDFGIYLDNKEFVIAEVKDLSGMLENRTQQKIEALLNFCWKKGFGLLFTNGKNSVDKIKKIKNNKKLEKEILFAVNDNVLRKRESVEILKRCNATQNELLKIIFKHHLKYRAFPFKLENGNKNSFFYDVFYHRKYYDTLITEWQYNFLSGKS